MLNNSEKKLLAHLLTLDGNSSPINYGMENDERLKSLEHRGYIRFCKTFVGPLRMPDGHGITLTEAGRLAMKYMEEHPNENAVTPASGG
jgi:hypothetical protein